MYGAYYHYAGGTEGYPFWFLTFRLPMAYDPAMGTTMKGSTASPQTYARIGGVLYLIIIAAAAPRLVAAQPR